MTTNDNNETSVERRLKVALISLLKSYRIPHEESWTVSKLICRMNRYPNKVLTNCEKYDKIIRIRGEDSWMGTIAWHAAKAKDLVERDHISKDQALKVEAPALWSKLSSKCRVYKLCNILMPAETEVWKRMSRRINCPPSDEVWKFALDLLEASRKK